MQTFTIAVSDEVLSDLRSRLIDKLRDRADCQGDLESRFNRDELCTIATLYWVTDSIGTSFRQDFDLPHNAKRPRITVPVAVTQSQEWNMPLFPRSIAERAAGDIRRYLAPDRGGQFIAFEEPQLVAQELTAFMRGLISTVELIGGWRASGGGEWR